MSKPRPPRSTPRRVLEWLGSGLASIAFIAFVCWIVNGAAGGGHFLWWVLAMFLLPIVLYLLFIAAVGASFIREGRRNVREARLRNESRPPDAPEPHARRSPPRRRKASKR